MSAWPGFPRCSAPTTFPLAELCAARLDGELFAIDDGWAAVDEPDLPAFRAMATAMRAPRSLIIERMSAAWVHGARDAPPAVAQFCVAARRAHRRDRRPPRDGARGADRRRRPRALRRDPLHLAGAHRDSTCSATRRSTTTRSSASSPSLIADRPSLAERHCTTVSTLPCACRTRRRLADDSSCAEPGRSRRASAGRVATQPSLTR